MKNRTWLVGPLAATLFAAACGDSGEAQSECASNADCPQGQKCGPTGACTANCTGSTCADAGAWEAATDVVSKDAKGDVRIDGASDAPHDGATDSGKEAADAIAVPCAIAEDCDDSNSCSEDTCVAGACQHAPIAGTHLSCENSKCAAVNHTLSVCTNQGGCAAAGDACGGSVAGACPRSECPFDAKDRYLDGVFPSFGVPYNDTWEYLSGEQLTNPSFPSYTADSCKKDSKGGVTRSSTHVRALHTGTINVTLTSLSTAQANFIKSTLTDAKGWVRAGLTFEFNTSFSSSTDIELKYCASCSVSVSGPKGAVNNKCGSAEFPHRDTDYNVIEFSSGSCFKALSNCSRWLINHEVGHALGLADRENPDTEGKTIMNHTKYYSIVWPSDDLITMVTALKTCDGKVCLQP